MRKVLILIGLVCTQIVSAQVGIGTDSPDPSSIFEVVSNSKGILIPRMTKDQRDLVENPVEGLLIYQTDVPVVQ